jgi:molybdenum cofactor cytidylyltransferase
VSDVAIVILAAGMSVRLGRPKQVLPLGGQPIVAHVGRRAADSKAARVMAVIGGARDETMAALEDIVDELIINDAYSDGQGTSIAAAIRHLEGTSHLLGSCEAVIFLLGDQPGIEPPVIDAVIDAWQQGGRIVMAKYTDRPGHPVLFDSAYWHELARLEGDQGGRTVIDLHRDDVVYVPIAAESPLDVDHESDWRVLQEWWARHP